MKAKDKFLLDESRRTIPNIISRIGGGTKIKISDSSVKIIENIKKEHNDSKLAVETLNILKEIL